MPRADRPPVTSRRARLDHDREEPRGGCLRDFGTALLVSVAGAALVWAAALLLAGR